MPSSPRPGSDPVRAHVPHPFAIGDRDGLRSLLGILSEGFVVLEPDGTPWLNTAACDLLGGDEATARALLEGSADAVLINGLERPLPRQDLIGLIDDLDGSPGGPAQLVGLLWGDGREQWLRIRRSDLPGEDGSVALFTDVTEDACAVRRLAHREACKAAQHELAAIVTSPLSSRDQVESRLLTLTADLAGGGSACLLRLDEKAALVLAGNGGYAERVGVEVPAETQGTASEISAGILAKLSPDPHLQHVVAAPFDLDATERRLLLVASPEPLQRWAEPTLQYFVSMLGELLAHHEALLALEEIGDRDPLTGLANFTRFYDRLEREAALALQRDTGLALVVFDIDELERVNQTFGTDAGDRVIAAVAQRLERVVDGGRRRESGHMIARLGGGKFGWLLIGADAVRAETTAELGRMQVAAAPYPGIGSLSVSAGVCDVTPARPQAAEVMRLAEGALYWAKTHGRNQVCRYRADVVAELSESDRVERLEQEVTRNGLRALARAVDLKDPTTHEHSARVGRIAELVALHLGWSDDRARLIVEASAVHDVGKIGISDAILFKPSPLSHPERELIQRHTVLGEQIVSEFLNPEQAAWVRSHHERWDGRGYPDGLSGEDIPDGARIIFAADALEVMTGTRPYSVGISLGDALSECQREAGHQFDPEVVAALRHLVELGELDWLTSADELSDLFTAQM